MRQIISKKMVFICFLSLFLVFEVSFYQPIQAGKGPYPEIAVKMAYEAIDILVKRSVCTSSNDCNIQERVQCSGDVDLATIYVHQADKISDETINDLISLCLKVYRENQQKVEIDLRLYKETHSEVIRHDFFGFFWAKPFMNVKLKGGKRQ